jgi:glycerol-3-phosphate acyltransferase PlsY
MSAFTLTLIVVLAYLLGSIPFGYLLVRFFRSEDIRKSGSGNIGATNVVRSGARGLGAATFLLDALKGFLAITVARALAAASPPSWPPLAQITWQGNLHTRLDVAAGVAALAVVLGHIYPVWLGFKGGKGVATAFGALVQLAPLAALVGLVVFVVTVLLSRYVSLASILGALAVPVAALLARGHMGPAHENSPWITAALLLLPAIVIAKHHANIRRLAAGTEYRFGSSKPRPA